MCVDCCVLVFVVCVVVLSVVCGCVVVDVCVVVLRWLDDVIVWGGVDFIDGVCVVDECVGSD